jgi:hypothetical protein
MQEVEAREVLAACILLHVLHYLKGMDTVEGSFTAEFFEGTDPFKEEEKDFEDSVEKNKELLEKLSDESTSGS